MILILGPETPKVQRSTKEKVNLNLCWPWVSRVDAPVGTVVGILFFGKVGARVYPSCDLDWTALFFEALGARRLDLPKILGAWQLDYSRLWSPTNMLLVWFFFLSWYGFPLDFRGLFSTLKLSMQSMWKMLVSSALMDSSLSHQNLWNSPFSFPSSFHLLPQAPPWQPSSP